jgi:transcriptional regulator with XRE-family HTH domain
LYPCGAKNNRGIHMQEITINDMKNYIFKNNLTQIQLAQALGISRNYLSKMLTGNVKPSERVIYKMTELLKSEPTQKHESHHDKQQDR